MYTLSDIKTDCFHFDSVKPCKPHKQQGMFCDNCTQYKKVESRILVIKFAASGDVLRTTSILPALHEKHKGAAVYWITAKNAVSIFHNNPFVKKVISESAEYLALLQVMQFDAVYNLEADVHSSALAAIAKSKNKNGFILDTDGVVKPANNLADEWFVMGINDDIKKKNTRTYFEHIYGMCGFKSEVVPPKIFLSEVEKSITSKFINEHSLNKGKKILGINTGAGKRWPLKKWGFSDYVALIEKLHAERKDVELVLFGGPEEAEYNKALVESLSFKIIDAGTGNDVRSFFALVDAVDVLLTPDSLSMHVGVALGKSVIVYTGPTSFTELDVFGKGDIIHSDIDCLSCYLNKCDKETNCMNTISVNTMVEVVIKNL